MLHTIKIIRPNGDTVILDLPGYFLYQKCNWYISKSLNTKYLTGRPATEHRRLLKFHRELLKPAPGQHVDHINGNGLDNRLCNLRICTRTQNMCNTRKYKKGANNYRGACYKKNERKWMAYISINKRWKHLGYFNSEIEAAKAYDKAALELHGEFARINFPETKIVT